MLPPTAAALSSASPARGCDEVFAWAYAAVALDGGAARDYLDRRPIAPGGDAGPNGSMVEVTVGDCMKTLSLFCALALTLTT